MCIERDNFNSNTQHIYKESLILNRILDNITMRFIIYTFDNFHTEHELQTIFYYFNFLRTLKNLKLHFLKTFL